MKSLSLSRPLVIIIIGLPGSGKSFFARQFADMFNAPLVSVDVIRTAIAPTAAYSPSEDMTVGVIAESQITELVKTGKTFLIDGGLNNRTARLAVERMAAKHGYGKMTIWVQTDEPTSVNRSRRRSAQRKYDGYNSPMDQAVFNRYKKLFGAPSPSENTVVISGKHTFATQARVILKKLVSPRDTSVTVRRTERGTTSTVSPDTPTDAQPRRRNVPIN